MAVGIECHELDALILETLEMLGVDTAELDLDAKLETAEIGSPDLAEVVRAVTDVYEVTFEAGELDGVKSLHDLL